MLTAPENPIVLPTDVQKAVDTARTNVIVMQGEERALRSACNALGIEIKDQANHKMLLEGKISALEADLKTKQDSLVLTQERLAEAQISLKYAQDQEGLIHNRITAENSEIDIKRTNLAKELEELSNRRNHLAKVELDLATRENYHSEKVRRLEEALRH